MKKEKKSSWNKNTLKLVLGIVRLLMEVLNYKSININTINIIHGQIILNFFLKHIY